MTYSPEATLDAKIAARNRCNQVANELRPQLAAMFEPLIDQKVLTQQGRLIVKLLKLLPHFPDENGVRVYPAHSAYSLAWCVNVCQSIKGHGTCIYEDGAVYVGNLAGTVLTKLCPTQEPAREDFTAEEIRQLREDYKEKQQLADDARAAFFPFGEYDR